MSVLVVGLSHRSAPVDLLAQAAISADDVAKVLHELRQGEHVIESVALSTCNRVEIYADVTRFHGGVQEVSELLARVSGVPLDRLSDFLYVHYEDRAVQHLLSVACGIDSMVVGEGQILGQVREAFQVAQRERSVGRVLGELFRHALRVGKRARTETAIGRTGSSLVSVGVRVAEAVLGPLEGRSVLVVGAGAMGALAAATLRQKGVGRIVVANRSEQNGARLAASYDGEPIGLDAIGTALAEVDLAVSSTGAADVVVPADVVERAVAARGGRPLFLLDLALPRDIDPAVRDLPGVTLADLDALRAVLDTDGDESEIEAVRRIVNEEVGVFLAWQRSIRVAPTVVALRARADELIAAELDRLRGRLPEDALAGIDSAVRRVVDKLLHAPTVRVKQLAEAPGGDRYAEALRELFGLDPHVTEAITVAEPAGDDT